MELSQLRSFTALAEAGSVTAAAERLCLTQPAVTQQLRALEREMGVRLFDRNPRGVVLTQAGRIFREYVNRGLSTIDAGRRAAIELEGGETGTLTIGAGVTTSVSLLPEWLQRFQREYPSVEVVVRTGRSSQVTRMVLDREIDLGIVTSRAEVEGLTYAPLILEEIVLVRKPDADSLPLARGGVGSDSSLAPSPFQGEGWGEVPKASLSSSDGLGVGTDYLPSSEGAGVGQLSGVRISQDELRRLPMIVFPVGTGFRDFLDAALTQQGVNVRVKMETDSVEAIKSFVVVGLGASFLPARSVESEIASGLLVKVDVDGLSTLRRETAAVYRTGSHRNAAVQGFLDLITGSAT